jgi:hypothetical protein
MEQIINVPRILQFLEKVTLVPGEGVDLLDT